ncbi:MAG: CARDB domain-containing protein [Candidatus Omnitrophota bacterium]
MFKGFIVIFFLASCLFGTALFADTINTTVTMEATNITPPNPTVASQFTIRGRITNTGETDIPEGSQFGYGYDYTNTSGRGLSGRSGASTTHALRRGESFEVEFRGTIMEPGDCILRVQELTIKDRNQSNVINPVPNPLRYGFRVEPAPVDLSIDQVNVNPAHPQSGDRVEINGFIKNDSAIGVSNVVGRMELLKDNQRVSNWPDTQPSNIAARGSLRVMNSYPNIEAGNYTVRLTADPANSLNDTNRNNNVKEISFNIQAVQPRAGSATMEATNITPPNPTVASQFTIRGRITNTGETDIPEGSQFGYGYDYTNTSGRGLSGRSGASTTHALRRGESFEVEFRGTIMEPGDCILRVQELTIKDRNQSNVINPVPNPLRYGFRVEPAPVDLSIDQVNVNPAHPQSGDRVEINGFIKNDSAIGVSNVVGRMELLKDNQRVSNWPDTQPSNIAARGSLRVMNSYPNIEAGNYTVRLTADPANSLNDTNRNNNVKEISFNIQAVQPSDLVVKTINIEANTVKYGVGSWVTFTVKNEGQGPVVGSIFLQKEVTKDGAMLAKSGYFEIQGGLAPGEEKAHRFKVGHDSTWSVGNYTLRVVADYRNQVREASENNNLSEAIQFSVVK